MSALRTVDWVAPGPVAWDFYNSDAFVCGIMGPFGSGKTTTAIMKGLTISAKQPKDAQGKRRSRGLIIRNTQPELKTTTIKTWHEWVPPQLGQWREHGPPTHFIDGPDGLEAEIIFMGLDSPEDVRKLLSMDLTWAYLNEAREAPKAIVDALTGRVGRFPPEKDGGCVSPQIIMDTNPPDTDHWWYVLAERDTSTERNAALLRTTAESEASLRAKGLLRPDQPLFGFFKQPGGRTHGAENIANLRAGYYDFLAAGKGTEFIKVYVDGEYGFVLDGKPVYPEYVDSTHCREFAVDPTLPLHIGMDFGLTPAATIGQRTPWGNWRILDEFVTEDMGARRFGEQLRTFLGERYQAFLPDASGASLIATITGDPAGGARDAEERTTFDILRAVGIDAKPAHTNDFSLRRDAFALQLNRMAGGEPGMLMHPRCKVLRKALMGGYCLRRMLIANRDSYHDKPDKNQFSHVAEAGQYMVIGAGEGRALVRAQPPVNRPQFADMGDPVFG